MRENTVNPIDAMCVHEAARHRHTGRLDANNQQGRARKAIVVVAVASTNLCIGNNSLRTNFVFDKKAKTKKNKNVRVEFYVEGRIVLGYVRRTYYKPIPCPYMNRNLYLFMDVSLWCRHAM